MSEERVEDAVVVRNDIDVEVRNMISGQVTTDVTIPAGSTVGDLVNNGILPDIASAKFTDMRGNPLSRNSILTSGQVIEVSKAIEGGNQLLYTVSFK